VLLWSWIGQTGLAERAAWVPVRRDERESEQFLLSVVGALRRTVPGAGLVQALTAAPDLDGWVIVERLLKDLVPLKDPLWLVVDDVHELDPQALRQLELLIMRMGPKLRFVLAARHDVRLRLHRLRLEGDLTEIRAADLRFAVDEARELFAAAGLNLPESALMTLHERTEGWVAGLRLVLISLGITEFWTGRFGEAKNTWTSVSCWQARSGGRSSSSPAGPTSRRSESTSRFHARSSAAGRRSSSPPGTAGARIRPLALLT
jgi:LuxR family transcriptional regulator, maltose regulon positive regulatory protein